MHKVLIPNETTPQKLADPNRGDNGRLANVQMYGDHNIPESLRAFCKIVSFTAAKTSRTLVVSVACVRLQSRLVDPSSYLLSCNRLTEGIGSTVPG